MRQLIDCLLEDCEIQHGTGVSHFRLYRDFDVLISMITRTFMLYGHGAKFFTCSTGDIMDSVIQPKSAVIHSLSGNGNKMEMDPTTGIVDVSRYDDTVKMLCSVDVLGLLIATAHEHYLNRVPSIMMSGTPIVDTYYCIGRQSSGIY